MVSHEDRRIERIGMIERSMAKAGKNLNMKKLIAMSCKEFGISRRTAIEYIKQIELCNGD